MTKMNFQEANPMLSMSQVHLMCKYLDKAGPFKGIMEVPDPYYGGAKGFELARQSLLRLLRPTLHPCCVVPLNNVLCPVVAVRLNHMSMVCSV
jgi:hypothetical protein